MRLSSLFARLPVIRPARNGSFKFGKVGYPAVVGLAVFFAYPGLVAHQDVAALSVDAVDKRWLAHLEQGPGKTVLAAKQGSRLQPAIAADAGAGPDPELDPLHTASIPAASQTTAPTIRTEIRTDRDPQRVNRSLKGDRVVSSTIVRPPAHFSAGSLLERQSMFLPDDAEKRFELAFVQARPVNEALQVASLFVPPADMMPPIDTDLPVMVASLVEESVPYLLAHSSEPEIVRSPFAAVLDESRPINLIPKLDARDHDWADDSLPLSAFGKREQHCLTAGIYFEARGEPVRGQAAVAQVILNRVRNPHYPDTICGVVYQNKRWRNRCQFSFACDRIPDRVRNKQSWEIAEYVARETTEGRIWLANVGSSTHYHATYVRPRWASKMERVGRIGLHIFYRTFGGGWS